MKQIYVLVFALFLFTASAMGQAARTATLVGNVTDSTGAAIPGAKVTLVNTETRFQSNGETNAEGAYYVPFLAVGSYQLSIEAGGFKKFVQDGIQLRAGEVPRIDAKLEVGAVNESIEVTGTVPLIQTETAQVSQTMEAETMVALPVLQLKAHRLLYYLEGVASRNANSSVVGLPENQLGFTLDGISAKTSVRDGIGDMDLTVQPAIDALAEAKIYTTGAPAEIGHAAGGMLSFTYKSGTNNVHGSFEDRYQSKSMVHRNYLEQLERKLPYAFHQMQGTVSGPVILPKIYDGRNKTFFLFGFGRHDERVENGQSGTVPDAAMLNGDFSFPKANGGGYPIYDPRSIRQAGSTWTADPFPGNVIPKSAWDPVAKNFLALNPWKEPNTVGSYGRGGPSGNWVGFSKKNSYRTRYDVKFDHQFDPNNKFFIRESYNRHRVASTQAWLNNLLLDNSSPSPGRPNPVDQQNWAAAYYHIFSPTLMNEFRVGFDRRVSVIDPPTVNQCWADKLGIPNVGCDHFPGLRDSGGSAFFGIGPGSFSQSINEDITLQNNITKQAGRNTFKFGYEMLRTRANYVDASLQSGNYNFGATGLPFTPNTGNSFAAFLVGSVTSADFNQQRFNRLPRWWTHSFYVQTDFKPTSNLTLNLGVRYSYESPFQTKYGQKTQWDPTVVDPLTGMMGAITHPTGTVYKRDLNNFQPRVGMAWHFKPSVVFRGSWGLLFTDLMPSAGFQEYASAVTFQQLPGDPRPAFFLSQGPPNRDYVISADGTTPYVGKNYSSRSATYLDPNLRIPYVMNWSAGFQFDLGHQWMQELVYQGSSGVGLTGSINYNQLPQWIYNSTDLSLLNSVYSAQQNYKSYTHFGSLSFLTNAGHSTYHGLTARIEKRYTENGLTFNAHYTWSKNLSGGMGDGVQYYNWGLTKGPTSFDTRHHIILMAQYLLPVGKGRPVGIENPVLNHILGGWEVGWVETLLSGPPVTFGLSGSPYRYLPGQGRPNQIKPNDQVRVDNWDIGPNRFPQQAQNPLWDISAFANPAAFTSGTIGYGTGRGLWTIWPQWSLYKTWRIQEKYSFTARLDGNNIPVRMGSITTPNTTVNLTSPELFGRFAPIGTNTSQLGTPNGCMVVGLRFEF